MSERDSEVRRLVEREFEKLVNGDNFKSWLKRAVAAAKVGDPLPSFSAWW